MGELHSFSTIEPDELENRIDHQALLLHTAPTSDERRVAWSELQRLHGLRTPARIAEMERAIR